MDVHTTMVPGLRTTALTPFSPYSDSPFPLSAMASKHNASLLNNAHLSASNAPSNLPGPSPIAPSPINSETTEFADVDDVEDVAPSSTTTEAQPPESKTSVVKSPALKLDTSKLHFAAKPVRSDEDEPPASVIYAPAGFGDFHTSPEQQAHLSKPSLTSGHSKLGNRTISTDSISSVATVTRAEPDGNKVGKFYDSQIPPTPLQTSIPHAPDWIRTPRAQTRQDLGVISRPGSSLASITESDDYSSDPRSADECGDGSWNNATTFFRNAEDELKSLNQALTECWTLCNTLAHLSNVHRERIFSFTGKGTMQQQAWRSCWKLCQNLYEAKDKANQSDACTTLQHCRDFCQALFDVRVRDNETADSVLRVSFELNNHLFNTHDRHLPEAFRERTLDFYITLCHRLMKQKTRTDGEPDNLLKTCWSLAETLFALRQSTKEDRRPDEEMIGSAIQACWDLCDLFREGWSSVRPDSRQTPRPSQTTFSQAFQEARKAGMTIIDENGNLKLHPETPTTMIDESTTDSPCEVPAPNIVMLGSSEVNASSNGAVNGTSASQAVLLNRQTTYKWPSSKPLAAHLITTSTAGSGTQPSTTTTSATEDQALVLLKSLFVRAALLTNRGFTPTNLPSSGTGGAQSQTNQLISLPLFVKSLPETAFGAQAWQMNLLDNYRRTVVNDNTFHSLGAAVDARLIVPAATDPSTSTRLRKEVASSVKGMITATTGWNWLKDLFRLTYGIYIEEVLNDGKPKQTRSRESSVESTDRSGSESEYTRLRSNSRAESATSDEETYSRSTSRASSRASGGGGGGGIASNSGEKRSMSVAMQRA